MRYPTSDPKRNAEGSRYALLRRLAPAMRHQLAGSMQPVTMMAVLFEKRLKAATPDVPVLIKSSADLRLQASAAARSSMDLMDWFACDPDATVPLDKGLQDALHLVAAELSFRGIMCINQTAGVTAAAALNHVRGLFIAGVLALTDAAVGRANLLLTALQDGEVMVVRIALTAVDTAGESEPHDSSQISLTTYRKIDWHDVEAIAIDDGVLIHHHPHTLTLRLPTASA